MSVIILEYFTIASIIIIIIQADLNIRINNIYIHNMMFGKIMGNSKEVKLSQKVKIIGTEILAASKSLYFIKLKKA